MTKKQILMDKKLETGKRGKKKKQSGKSTQEANICTGL
jgi:hypothetical protein